MCQAGRPDREISIMTQPMNNVCVVGSGFMGNQIALQCAAAGKSTWMHDIREEVIQSSAIAFTRFLDRMIDDGCAPADQRQPILEANSIRLLA